MLLRRHMKRELSLILPCSNSISHMLHCNPFFCVNVIDFHLFYYIFLIQRGFQHLNINYSSLAIEVDGEVQLL